MHPVVIVLGVLIAVPMFYQIFNLIIKHAVAKCPNCGGLMKSSESKTVFEGAANIAGNNFFPQLIIERTNCSKCGNGHYKLHSRYESDLRYIKGDLIREYIHIDDSDVIEHYNQVSLYGTFNPLSKHIRPNVLRENVCNSRLPPTGLAISENAFRHIYQKIQAFVQENNDSADSK